MITPLSFLLGAADKIGPSLLVLRDRLGIAASKGVGDAEASGSKAFHQLGVTAWKQGGGLTPDPSQNVDLLMLCSAARAYLTGSIAKVPPPPRVPQWSIDQSGQGLQ
jgi:hypothetical protein